MQDEEKMADLIDQKTEAQQNFNDAQEEYNRLVDEAEAYASNHNNANLSEYQEGISQAETAMESARSTAEALDGEIESLQADMDALDGGAQSAASGIDGVADSSSGLITSTDELKTAMEGVFAGVEEQAQVLAAAYQEAYSAAADAVDSSFDLFEKIELDTSQSATDMVAALKSQKEYLEEYAENINKAKEYGLDESLVENLADGSQESAAELDAIISKIEELGTTTDSAKGFVDEMNESFEGVQTAKGTLEEAMVGVNTTLTEQLDSLTSAVETAVGDLNLSEDAAGAATETMNAYIAAIEELKGSAVSAAEGVASAVASVLSTTEVTNYNAGYKSGASAGDGIVAGVNSSYAKIVSRFTTVGKDSNTALNKVWKINSPSKQFQESSEYAMEGILVGVDEYEDDVTGAFGEVAERSVDSYKDKIEALAEVTDEYLGLVSDRYGEYSEEASEAVSFVIDRLDSLSDAYGSNYDSAYKSITSTLGLFNDVEIDTSKSIDEMIDSLGKQSDYMAEYGAYMKQAMEMGVDEGILQQLSDGSEQSAGILKEIVTNGSDRIDELNAAFAKVEEGKETFSAAMAEMETYYSGELDAIVADLEGAVGDMDQYDEAYQGAESTCQGILDGIDSKWQEIIDKYSELAAAASSAFSGIGISTSVTGHASGTTYGEDVYIAGENGPELIVGRRGSEVFPASETARILSAVMSDRGGEQGIALAPQDVTNTIIQESKSSSTENRNMTLTIKGKGALDIGQSVSKKDLTNYIRDELEGAIMNIMMREIYEEGDAAYEF
jgi:hypothetical protein